MPLARVDLVQGKSADYRKAIGDVIYDAMLKHFKLIDGSVYKRIDEAVSQHILTAAMGEWAHEVRLGSNRPRHSDAENPHVSPQQAQQAVEFAEALGHFLFVLSSRVNKGIEDAKTTES